VSGNAAGARIPDLAAKKSLHGSLAAAAQESSSTEESHQTGGWFWDGGEIHFEAGIERKGATRWVSGGSAAVGADESSGTGEVGRGDPADAEAGVVSGAVR
jgi:hypothetical protein